MFDPEQSDSRDPPPVAVDERINVLLVGVDATRLRTTVLTDTMMVVSLDPVGHTVTILSLPRDLIDVPLGNGDVFAPKLNSLMSYADSHPDDSPTAGWPRSRTRSGRCSGSTSSTTPAAVRELHPDGRCGRRRRCRRGAGLRGPDLRRLRPGGTRLVDHGRTASSRRSECACVRAIAQGRPAKATSRGRCASSRSSSRCATPSRRTAASSGSCRDPDRVVGDAVRTDMPPAPPAARGDQTTSTTTRSPARSSAIRSCAR